MKKVILCLLLVCIQAADVLGDDEVFEPTTKNVESGHSLYLTDAIWTSSQGQSLKLRELAGRPVVLALFYASCESACPLIVDAMKRLEKALTPQDAEKLRFVLVTFDTEGDTPESLRAYAKKQGLADTNWVLLRGTNEDTLELAVLLGSKFKKTGPKTFAHSNLIAILDREGNIAARANALDKLELLTDQAKSVLHSNEK